MNVQEIVSFLEQRNFKSIEVFENQVLADWGNNHWLNIAPDQNGGWLRFVLSECWSGSEIVNRLFFDLEAAIVSLTIAAAVDLEIESERVASISQR